MVDNIGWLLIEALRNKKPNKHCSFALMCDDEGYEADQLVKIISARAIELRKLGVKHSDIVICVCGRGIDFWIDSIALWCIGAVPVPVEAAITAASFNHILQKSNAARIIGVFEHVNIDDLDPLPETKRVERPLADMVAATNDIKFSATDDAVILFTSGSTGEPKGVLLTHKAYCGNALATKTALELLDNDLLFFAIPYRFVSAQSHVIVALLSGASVYSTEKKLMLGDFVRYSNKTKITAFGGSPLQARWINEALKLNAGKPESEKLFVNLRWVMTSGSHMPEAVIKELRSHKPGLAFRIVYGMTELAGRFCVNDLSHSNAGVGFPVAGFDCEIRGSAGQLLAANELGDVYAKGAHVFSGYINDPDKTDAALSKKLGLLTGDVGYKDDLGQLYLVGRSDDVFKVAGLKVSGLVVSSAILSITRVADIVVVPEEDDVAGYLPHVLYVPQNGRKLDKGDLITKLRAILPANHIPRRFTIVEKIPRTASGKVDRRALNALVKAL